jgi:hypothetical protein
MKIASRIALALAVVLLAATAAFAADAAAPVTLTGKIACGHCTLKLEGLKDCQDVLVVTGADGKASHYYVVKNDVAKKFGHVCKSEGRWSPHPDREGRQAVDRADEDRGRLKRKTRRTAAPS